MKASLPLLLCASIIACSPAQACSRALFKNSEGGVFTGRSMDWMNATGTDLFLFPRGLSRDGGTSGNTLKWTSKYGSLISSFYNAATADGMNEKGLVANLLYLSVSDYGAADGKPTLNIAAWTQYVLDNFATVAEAVAALEKEPFRIIAPILPGGVPANGHLSISDPSGDSAIFEYIDGKLVIHHGPQYKVMTNEPAYSEQLAINKYWQEVKGNDFLPGTSRPADRFARASFNINAIPQKLDPAYAAMPGTETRRIAVDQFGYRQDMAKVAIISDPQSGFNAAESYTPGGTLEVRSWGDNTLVFSAAPTAWNSGLTHSQSGDRVWSFDFSAVTKWGEYYVYDPARDARSPRFRIAHDVYAEPLKHAMRVFFYQRRGCAKQPPHADARWADTASHLGALQDSQCRPVTEQGNAALQKDLRGGWFDAGDYNKYANFASLPLANLLFAYQQNPRIWPDDWSLPESGNGVPDLLDEVRWELDWLLRMQNPDGSVLSKVGVTAYQNASPPSADTTQMFYGAASTASTFSSAAAFAHGSLAFAAAGQASYAATLRTAAQNAWTWAVANPSVTFSNSGFQSANPEGDWYDRSMWQLRAAIFLYALTGEAGYKTFVENNYTNAHSVAWPYWYAFEAGTQDALLFYASLPGASAGVVSNIRNTKQSSMGGSEFLPAWNNRTDPYRAYMKDGDYVWGNNQFKCLVGIIFANQNTYGMDTANATAYRDASAGYLHYMHGVNPLSMAYLTNMYESGGDFCANQIYHSWFTDGSDWDDAKLSPKGPPPGYVPGGCYAGFAPNGGYSGPRLAPPMDQPPQKAYRDWNSSDYLQESWEITEPSIYTQASYVFLNSRFVRPLTFSDWVAGYGLTSPNDTAAADPDRDGMPNLMEYALNGSPTRHDAPPTLVFQTLTVNGTPGVYATVTLPRHLSTGDISYEVQGSSDLVQWDTLCTAAGQSTPSGSGFVSETGTATPRTLLVRTPSPVAQVPRYFLRIRVTKS